VDVVVNGMVGAEALSYRGAQRTRYLLGPRYLLLRPEFAGGPERVTHDEVTRVLVLVGGGDLGSLLKRLTDAILETLPEVAVDVVIGPFGGRPPMDPRIHVHTMPKDMLALMLGADLAVSGAGQTAYELAATGTPAVGIRLADNQTKNLRGLAAAGCLRAVGAPKDDGFWERLTGTLRTLAADASERRRMTVRGRGLVDGGGTARVATYLCAVGGLT
jgi:spore coat polysaccharide biosynthesis predicted glycosyltransferase SpsG